METDRTRWDRRFAQRDDTPAPPEPRIISHLTPLARGPILDVACGDGRNALPLAALGFEVTGVDVSRVALARLQRFSDERDLTVRTLPMDLDLGEGIEHLGPFDHVIVSHFKPSRMLWSVLPGCMQAGGTLVLVTFNHRQAELGFPLEYCLTDRELVDVHPFLRCVEYTPIVHQGRHLDAYVFERTADRSKTPAQHGRRI